MIINNLYKGYSSFEYQRIGKFQLSDIDLVKLDLLNHIFTRPGERVMMPTYGTRIPSMAFEPLDNITISIIEEDLRNVIAADPRVELQSMQVQPNYDQNAIEVKAVLLYVELDMTDVFYLNITFEGGGQ